MRKVPPLSMGIIFLVTAAVALPAAQSKTSRASKASGGQLTVITGADKALVRIRSTRFF